MPRRREASPRRAEPAPAAERASAPGVSRAALVPLPPHIAAAQDALVAEIERARLLYEESGVPVRVIARRLGRTERMIYKHAARYGWKRRGHARGPKPRRQRPPLWPEAWTGAALRSFPPRRSPAEPSQPVPDQGIEPEEEFMETDVDPAAVSESDPAGAATARDGEDAPGQRDRNVMIGEPARAERIARARMLYEETSVPVREIAILVDATEGMILRWARRFAWKPRAVVQPRAARGRLLPLTDAERPAFRGRRAREAGAAEAAAARCVRAGLLTERAASAIVAETRRRAVEQQSAAQRRAAERQAARDREARVRLWEGLAREIGRLATIKEARQRARTDADKAASAEREHQQLRVVEFFLSAVEQTQATPREVAAECADRSARPA